MSIINVLILYLCFTLIITNFSTHSDAELLPSDAARNHIRGPKIPASEANTKTTLRKTNRVNPKRSCGELGTRSECSQRPKCRWCRSDAIDDMCFSKSEAFRLPPQVFSCEL